MKILVIGKFYKEGFALHIEEALRHLGHEVFRYEPGLKYSSTSGVLIKRWNQVRSVFYEGFSNFSLFQRLRVKKMVDAVAKVNPEIIIVIHDFLLPEEIKILKRETCASIVLWYPDHIGMFGRSFFLNGGYDALFFKDPYVVWYMKQKTSLPVYYLPECFNPNSLKEIELSEEDVDRYGCDITTAGNIYPYRGAFFEQLKEYNLKIWGNPPPLWMDISRIKGFLQNRFVADAEKVKAFRAAKIVINSLQPAEIWGVNARAFEIAGAGGFQLIDWRPGLDHLFEDESEIVSFRGIEDLKKKINFFLNEDELRINIAQRGRSRALMEHTYEKRLQTLLGTVTGNMHGFPMPKTMSIKGYDLLINDCLKGKI
jgi:spore maturation protein CgeB